ncbi:MAG TPA: hypothetical protein VMU57_22490 [Edaphobacter sp.]|uniref:hypothetical protein n=1 Tax=Edaphobacter sp. TaxID=1934404 RepID=UPI002BB21AB9|nr:hypothetical protein [Edaphobacter sp.]HUZ97683.1 hypothetical protein [Edaphobacter sp.]
MTYRKAIEIIYAQYPAAAAHYEPAYGWRILSDHDGSQYSTPLGPYRPDRERAVMMAAENLSR